MLHPERETQVKWFVEGIISILFSLKREVTCMEGSRLIFLLLSIHYIGSVFACFPCSKTEAYVSERPARKLWEPVSIQFGVDLDEFVTSLDPVKAYRTMMELSDPSFLLSKLQHRRLRQKQQAHTSPHTKADRKGLKLQRLSFVSMTPTVINKH
jgi:hypothetical protein